MHMSSVLPIFIEWSVICWQFLAAISTKIYSELF